ncbi:MAG: peptidylprolyl isomerase [Candidatus Aenigmarchaeota archaeon]|nr:peptidylprolyl isomerase [Candidatus Aenigmarchaeota archaeon]
MKDGDIVYIHYIGTVKETGEVFDITDKEKAKELNVYNPKVEYGPIPIIIGGKFILPTLEEEIKKMGVGEEKEVELPPEKAFGNRSKELIRSFSYNDFQKQGITPRAGEWITINNLRGRIISVSGGRVMVDFNHPLAGKTLHYKIKVVKKVEKPEEKVKAILEFYMKKIANDFDIEMTNDECKIIDKKNVLTPEQRKILADTILKWINEISKLKFVYEFQKESTGLPY